jgi:hypothetical protein
MLVDLQSIHGNAWDARSFIRENHSSHMGPNEPHQGFYALNCNCDNSLTKFTTFHCDVFIGPDSLS